MKPPSVANRGAFRGRAALTLVDTIVSMGILALLMGALFAIYQIGTSAWQKVSVRSELTGQMHLVSSRLATACGRAPIEGITISSDGSAIAVCSPLLDNGKFALDTEAGILHWQKWEVTWFDPDSAEIRSGQVPLTSPSPQVVLIDSVDPDWLDSLPSKYKVIARDVTLFQVARRAVDSPVLELEFEGKRRRYGRLDEETVALRTTVKVGRP